jgi:hypothetical protein
MPKGMPATPLAPAIPLAIVPAPAANSAKSRVADVEAPAVPNRSYPLREPPPGVVRERLTFMVSTLMFGVVLMGFCYLLGITWLVITFSVFFQFCRSGFVLRKKRSRRPMSLLRRPYPALQSSASGAGSLPALFGNFEARKRTAQPLQPKCSGRNTDLLVACI